MTETQWLVCEEPLAMMNYLEREAGRWYRAATQASNWVHRIVRVVKRQVQSRNPWVRSVLYRRLYLAACGMQRLHFPVLVNNGTVPPAYEAEEAFAGCQMSLAALLADDPDRRWWWPNPWHLVSNVIRAGCWTPGPPGLWPQYCQVFRDIFETTLRPVTLDPSWLTS